MPRPLEFGLAAAVSLFAGGTGCTSTSGTHADAAAAADAEAIDAGPCVNGGVLASNYDQSCSADSDCVAVDNAGCCSDVAINVAAHAQYLTGVAACTGQGGVCTSFCPYIHGPCCRSGMCRADNECSTPEPVADAGSGAAVDVDACGPPTVCSGACVTGSRNVSTMVDGCLVSQCCVPTDAAAE